MEKNKFGVPIPKKCTKSFSTFTGEINKVDGFTTFIFFGYKYIQENIDRVREEIAQFFENPESDDFKDISEEIRKAKLDHWFNIKIYEDIYGQMLYARAVDNVISYFKDIIGEIIIERPDILKSSKETETLDFILKFDNMNDLKFALSEKKIEHLFYKGIDEIEKYFRERLGVDLFKNDDEKKWFYNANKKRNLIVHNRGLINKEYLKKFPECDLEPNTKIYFKYADVSYFLIEISKFVSCLDTNLSTKFGLNLIDNY